MARYRLAASIAVTAVLVSGCSSDIDLRISASPPVGCPDEMRATATMPDTPFRPDYHEMVTIEPDREGYEVGGGFREYHAPGVLQIDIENDTANPDATIADIAETHRGVIVETERSQPEYSVRFCGYGFDDLVDLGDAIREHPSVVRAFPYQRLWEEGNL